MTTRVVNIRSRDWQAVPEAEREYIGRVHPRLKKLGLTAGQFGNQYRISAKVPRERAIELYELHQRQLCRMIPYHIDEIRALRGKTLICWCAPLPCHGDVLARLADMSQAEYDAWVKGED